MKTLSNDFMLKPEIAKGYTGFMEGLLSLVNCGPLCQLSGDQIRRYALQFVQTHSFSHFDQYSAASYIRNYIGRDTETHWEALVMSWQKGNRTAIHSHPQFASYTFADGEFLVEIFKVSNNQLHLSDQLEIKGLHGLYAIGEPGRFDNHIHRITCLSETAHSLHIYSDDALKGLKYEEPIF